jgi:hypothetical protein
MTRLIAILVLGLLVFGGCSEEPKDAYRRIVFHAKMGNEAAFLDGFTEDSRKIIKTLLSLRRTYGDLVDRDSDPYFSIVLEEIEDVVIDEKEFRAEDSSDTIERKVATLTVTDGKILRKIRMIEFDDGWKIDATDLQDFWAKDRKNFLERQ